MRRKWLAGLADELGQQIRAPAGQKLGRLDGIHRLLENGLPDLEGALLRLFLAPLAEVALRPLKDPPLAFRTGADGLESGEIHLGCGCLGSAGSNSLARTPFALRGASPEVTVFQLVNDLDDPNATVNTR